MLLENLYLERRSSIRSQTGQIKVFSLNLLYEYEYVGKCSQIANSCCKLEHTREKGG